MTSQYAVLRSLHHLVVVSGEVKVTERLNMKQKA